eukprot:TRINITY_DN2359_c0_g2_i1.p1 TRINITY_DN2359_c0_g2~~TRINITY_DN2359_c0_g2_i1.p1  ORF type:complete len:284 (-),score=55.02 TRINITY_DN2359_c0_g2_i1:103-954(-)
MMEVVEEEEEEIEHEEREERSGFLDEAKENQVLRSKYRTLIDTTKEKEEELINSASSDALIEVIRKGSKLFEKVKGTREASLDSEFLSITSRYSAEKVNKLSGDSLGLDVNLYSKMLLQKVAVQNGEENEIHLSNIYSMVDKYLKPTIGPPFMYGPLDKLPKQKKVSQKQRITKEKAAPKTVAKELEPQQDTEIETSKQVMYVHERLEDNGKENLWKFIVDPNSFSKSVENLFHFAFLVKDGRASVSQDSLIDCADPPTGQQGRRNQCVIQFTKEKWQVCTDY